MTVDECLIRDPKTGKGAGSTCPKRGAVFLGRIARARGSAVGLLATPE